MYILHCETNELDTLCKILTQLLHSLRSELGILSEIKDTVCQLCFGLIELENRIIHRNAVKILTEEYSLIIIGPLMSLMSVGAFLLSRWLFKRNRDTT